jgi:DNA-binding NarL/FixJ family response regulator
MKPLNIVVAQMDSKKAEMLAASLHDHFRTVSVARSLEELRSAIPRHRADVAIVDLELVSVPEVAELHSEFAGTRLICTHRVPDDEMWTSAMSAGASDVCPNDSVPFIVVSALRSIGLMTQAQAA